MQIIVTWLKTKNTIFYLNLASVLIVTCITKTMEDQNLSFAKVPKSAITFDELIQHANALPQPIALSTDLHTNQDRVSLPQIAILAENDTPPTPKTSNSATTQQWFKQSAGLAGLLGFSTYAAHRLHQARQHQQKRFIADAINGAATATTISMDLLKGGTACIAGVYTYYKVRCWLYDGYVKQQDLDTKMQTLEKKTNALVATLQQQAIAQAQALNTHATLLDAASAAMPLLQAQTKDLITVSSAHAQELDKHAIYLKCIADEAKIYTAVINRNSQLSQQSHNDTQTLAQTVQRMHKDLELAKESLSQKFALLEKGIYPKPSDFHFTPVTNLDTILQEQTSVIPTLPTPPALPTPKTNDLAAVPHTLPAQQPTAHAPTVVIPKNIKKISDSSNCC